MGKIYIGTSGWHYKHWKGPFYPQAMDSKDFLNFYVKTFSTVELNNPFYRIPKKETFKSWRLTTPDNFIFAVKANRYITHIKKLNDSSIASDFLKTASILKEKMGPVLFQLPPKWKCNLERLFNFLKNLPNKYKYAFEFRNSTWFNDEVYGLLREYKSALCIHDLKGNISPKKLTTNFVYIRFHGPAESKYQGSYDDTVINNWAKDITQWHKQNNDIYCYFNNDQAGYAVKNAATLKQMIKLE